MRLTKQRSNRQAVFVQSSRTIAPHLLGLPMMGISIWCNELIGGGSMTSWKCGNCGYEMEADTPPDTCPSCKEKCEFLDNSCYTPDCDAVGKDPRIG
jgi:rubredoxin